VGWGGLEWGGVGRAGCAPPAGWRTSARVSARDLYSRASNCSARLGEDEANCRQLPRRRPTQRQYRSFFFARVEGRGGCLVARDVDDDAGAAYRNELWMMGPTLSCCRASLPFSVKPLDDVVEVRSKEWRATSSVTLRPGGGETSDGVALGAEPGDARESRGSGSRRSPSGVRFAKTCGCVV
jgi:hypothetical protein